MKSLIVVSSFVLGFVFVKVYTNKKLKNELYLSLKDMNKNINLYEDEVVCELVNSLPQSRSPTPESILTDTSTPNSFTFVNT